MDYFVFYAYLYFRSILDFWFLWFFLSFFFSFCNLFHENNVTRVSVICLSCKCYNRQIMDVEVKEKI